MPPQHAVIVDETDDVIGESSLVFIITWSTSPLRCSQSNVDVLRLVLPVGHVNVSLMEGSQHSLLSLSTSSSLGFSPLRWHSSWPWAMQVGVKLPVPPMARGFGEQMLMMRSSARILTIIVILDNQSNLFIIAESGGWQTCRWKTKVVTLSYQWLYLSVVSRLIQLTDICQLGRGGEEKSVKTRHKSLFHFRLSLCALSLTLSDGSNPVLRQKWVGRWGHRRVC